MQSKCNNKLSLVFSGQRNYIYPAGQPFPNEYVKALTESIGYSCGTQDYYIFSAVAEPLSYISVNPLGSRRTIKCTDFNAWYKVKCCVLGAGTVRFLTLKSNNFILPCLDVYGNQIEFSCNSCFTIPGYSFPLIVQNKGRNVKLALSILHVQPKWRISPWLSPYSFCFEGAHVYDTIRLANGTSQLIPDPDFLELADKLRENYLSQLQLQCVDPVTESTSLNQVTFQAKYIISSQFTDSVLCGSQMKVIFQNTPQQFIALMDPGMTNLPSDFELLLAGLRYILVDCTITLQYKEFPVKTQYCASEDFLPPITISNTAGDLYVVYRWNSTTQEYEATGARTTNNHYTINSLDNTVTWRIRDVILLNSGEQFYVSIQRPIFADNQNNELQPVPRSKIGIFYVFSVVDSSVMFTDVTGVPPSV